MPFPLGAAGHHLRRICFAEPQRREHALRWKFGAALLFRLLYPYFNSPLDHLFSDPGRHWENGLYFLQPNLMGSGDPYLYQLWMFCLQQLTGKQPAAICLGCGVLSAAMPYGWYRALKEILPRAWALTGGLLMALTPEFFCIYAYFMNETLLLSLGGFAFWATFRAQRKRSFGAFITACALWLAAGFTRVAALPMAALCLGLLWLTQPQKLARAAAGLVLAAALIVPAGLHGRVALHYFAPFGNLYLNEIYRTSGYKDIAIDFGQQGNYQFGSPSYYNPTFYPYSRWLTARWGTVFIRIDTGHGRADWIAEAARVKRECLFSPWLDRWENFLYLSFGQPWPETDLRTLSGRLVVWSRWLWPLLIALVAGASLQRRYRGREWLLPACGLGLYVYFCLQSEGVMEARFRLPVDPEILAGAVILARHVLTNKKGPVPSIAQSREPASVVRLQDGACGRPVRILQPSQLPAVSSKGDTDEGSMVRCVDSSTSCRSGNGDGELNAVTARP